MSEANEYYTFYFKIIYTERVYYFTFNPDITIKNFIQKISDEMREISPNNTIEIIEAGQIDNINNSPSEQAPKIDYPDEYTLRDIYRNKWRNTAFYIRFIPNHQNSDSP